MKVDIKELETADYDILENVKVAFYRLWKLKMIVVMCTLIGFCASLIFVGIVGVKTNYRSNATIYSVVYGSYTESNAGVTVMNTYSGLIGTSRVCERAAEKLVGTNITGEYLRAMVNSGRIYLSGANRDSKKYGYSLTLVSTLPTPENAVDITNAMANAFADEINSMLGTSSVQVMDIAQGYYAVNSLNVKLVMLLFTAAGMMLSAGFIFVKEFFSVKVYSVAQCEQNKDMILGLIPYKSK
ncbi:MAG: hypothetical protein E7287_03600 [Lachnospiraceae bacterium]|nr:hypothetical protein [Lachnospiraceae bacterium]